MLLTFQKHLFYLLWTIFTEFFCRFFDKIVISAHFSAYHTLFCNFVKSNFTCRCLWYVPSGKLLITWENERKHCDGEAASVSLSTCLAAFFAKKGFLAKNNAAVARQPPYSLDLASCDFWLLPKLKAALKGLYEENDGRTQEHFRGGVQEVLLKVAEALKKVCTCKESIWKEIKYILRILFGQTS